MPRIRPALPRPATHRFIPHVGILEDRLTPATFYVDPSTSMGSTTFNSGNPGQTTGLTFGTNLFNTLDDALQAALDNGPTVADTIQLASTNITVANTATSTAPKFSQVVTLNGNGTAPGTKSVLVPAIGFTDTSLSLITIAGAGNVVTFNNVTLDGNSVETGYTMVEANTGARLNFTNGTVQNYSRGGLLFNQTGGTQSTVSGSKFLGDTTPAAGTVHYGIEVYDFSTVLITGNTIQNNLSGTSAGAQSAGVFVDSSSPSNAGVTLLGNTLQGNEVGLIIGDAAGDTSVLQVGYNNFLSNTFASIDATFSQANVDATANWFGSASGPVTTGTNKTIGNLTTSPFITRGPVPVASATSFSAYLTANSTATSTSVSDVTVTVSTGAQNINLTATVSGTNVVGTVTFSILDNDTGATIGTPVTVSVSGGSASATYSLPAGTTPDTYTIAADYSPGVELLFSSSGTANLVVNPVKLYAVGAGTGGNSQAKVYNPDNSVRFTSNPLGGFSGGVRVAMADVTGDGVDDLIAGAGPGGQPTVVVIDGVTQQEVARFLAFEATFTGGVYVAAGDFDGDGFADVVVSPDQGGGPVVAVYRGAQLAAGNASELVRYFGITDASFRGGARPAVGDVNNDGVPDIVVSAGFLGGPRIQIWDGKTIASGTKPDPNSSLANFFAFEDTLRNGCFVSVGDVNGDGFADLIFGGGPGGGPRVRIADGKGVLSAGGFGTLDNPAVASLTISNFFAGSDANRGGVRVSATDLDNNGLSEVFTGSGDGEPSTVRRYADSTLLTSNPTPSLVFDPFNAVLLGGVFVG